MLIGDISRHKARRYPAKTAVISEGRQLSWAAVDERANRLATYLLSAGLTTGDRVAVCARNTAEWPEVTYGLAKAGLVLVPDQPGGVRAVELQPVAQVGLVGLPARLAAHGVEPLQPEPEQVAGPRSGQDAGQQPGQRGLRLSHRLPDERQRAGVFPRSGHGDDPLVCAGRPLRRDWRRRCDRLTYT